MAVWVMCIYVHECLCAPGLCSLSFDWCNTHVYIFRINDNVDDNTNDDEDDDDDSNILY